MSLRVRVHVLPGFDQSTQSNDRDIVLGEHDIIGYRLENFSKNCQKLFEKNLRISWMISKFFGNKIKYLEYLKFLHMMSNS